MRVLYAGSSAADMRLAGTQLTKRGFAVTADLVRTPEEFAVQLRALPYDLVLAEFQSHKWWGDSALRIWTQHSNSAPFILIVSTADEDEAFECVRRGATDYVLKTNLERLPLAVWQHREAANRAKKELLSNLSYELRASVSEIIGMTELTLETELTPEQREYLEVIRMSGDSLLATLGNILEASGIQNGEPKREEIEFDLHDTLGEAAGLLATAARRKGLELLVDIRPDVPRFVQGDPAQLRKVLSHLLGNAVKFAAWGGIVLQADLESENEEGVLMHFVVSDAGVAIPRAAGPVASGGRVGAESEPGRDSGSHFTALFKRPKEGRNGQ